MQQLLDMQKDVTKQKALQGAFAPEMAGEAPAMGAAPAGTMEQPAPVAAPPPMRPVGGAQPAAGEAPASPNPARLREAARFLGAAGMTDDAKLALDMAKDADETIGAAEKAESREATADVKGNIVLQNIDMVKESIGSLKDWRGTGGLGKLLSIAAPGTVEWDAAALLETVQANIAAGQLQEMRENSPTGGALGNVSDKDIKLLGQILGNITLSVDRSQFMFEMDRLHNITMDTVHGTPEQIKRLIKRGELTEEEAGPLMERRPLRKSAASKTAPAEGAQEDVGDIPDISNMSEEELLQLYNSL